MLITIIESRQEVVCKNTGGKRSGLVDMGREPYGEE
jgi:hypothetical protein